MSPKSREKTPLSEAPSDESGAPKEESRQSEFYSNHFTPEAKGIWISLSEKAKNFTQRLYEKHQTSLPESEKSEKEKKLARWQTRTEIWHDKEVEKALNTQIRERQNTSSELTSQVKTYQEGITTSDQQLERLKNLGQDLDLKMDEAIEKRLTQEKQKLETLQKQTQETQTKKEQEMATLKESLDEYASARREATEKLTHNSQEKIASNSEQMAENNQDILQISQEISQLLPTYQQGKERLKKIRTELTRFKATGFATIDQTAKEQLQSYLRQAEERFMAVENDLKELENKKRKYEAENQVLTLENNKLQGTVTQLENKYLNPQERQAQKQALEQNFKILLEQGNFSEAQAQALAQGNFEWLEQVALAALEKNQDQEAQKILKSLPEARRNKILSDSLKKSGSKMTERNQRVYLNLITDLKTRQKLETTLSEIEGRLAKTSEQSPNAEVETIEGKTQPLQTHLNQVAMQYRKKYGQNIGSKLKVESSLAETKYTPDQAAPIIFGLLKKQLKDSELKKPAIKTIKKWLTVEK